MSNVLRRAACSTEVFTDKYFIKKIKVAAFTVLDTVQIKKVFGYNIDTLDSAHKNRTRKNTKNVWMNDTRPSLEKAKERIIDGVERKSDRNKLQKKKPESILRERVMNILNRMNQNTFRDQIIPGNIENRRSRGCVHFGRDGENGEFRSHERTKRRSRSERRKRDEGFFANEDGKEG